MWKARPVIASAVGGIRDQIDDGVHGLLVEDPSDLEGISRGLRWLLEHPERAAQLGRNAHQRVGERFLAPRSLSSYAALMARLAAARAAA